MSNAGNMPSWMKPETISPQTTPPVGADNPSIPVALADDTGLRKSPDKSVSDFHLSDDKDLGDQAHHHTLGWGPGQAAPGKLISEPEFLTPTYSDAWIAFGSGHEAPGIAQQGRKVIVKGTYYLSSGMGNRVLIVPAKLRPTRIKVRGAWLNGAWQRFDINPNGDANFITGTASAGMYAALHIEYYLDN